MSMQRPSWIRIVFVLAIGAIIAGVVAVVAGVPQPASFEWFAYGPLAEATFSLNGAVIVTGAAIAGAAAVAAGIALLSFWAGYTIRGSRTPS